MKRFNAIWKYSGSYSDETDLLSEGASSLTVLQGETLYFGFEDWFAGILIFTPSNSTATYAIEYFDGDEWHPLSLEEILLNQSLGTILQRGSLYWGSGFNKWPKIVFTTTVPEAGTPINSVAYYWARIRILTGSFVLDRALPQPFNTYASVEEMGEYIGYSFDEINPPTKDTVRKMLRASEDWFDAYTRRSFRLRVAYNETYDFNAYGVKLRKYPPLFLVSVGLWNGSTFEDMVEGRGHDFFLDQNTGMLRFTLPSFRLRYYSWLLSRYMRQSNSLQVTYAYGTDFNTSDYAQQVKRIILLKTGSALVAQNDWTAIFTSGLDTVAKPEKMKEWAEKAEEEADLLRMPLVR